MRVAAIALALVAACSSNAPAPSSSGTTPAGSPSNSPTPKGQAAGGSSPGRVGGSPARSAPGSSAPAPLGSSSGSGVALAKTCVHRGDATDRQTLTVTAGPGDTVTYSTYYSDYSTELNRPDYTTGHGYGQAGPDGRYRVSWVVPAQATPGRATVRVTAGDMEEDAQEASFIVVKQGERCP